MLADSPKPEAYHSQPGLDKYFQHYVMLRLTTIIVMFIVRLHHCHHFCLYDHQKYIQITNNVNCCIITALNVKLVIDL